MKLEPDIALARLAAPQFGVFTRAQAKACGLSNRMIQYRLESERWDLLHPTVYAVAGVASSWHRDQIAACFWCRGASAGLAAGFLHGLPGCEGRSLEVVTRDRRRAMPRCGITVHTTNRLPSDQVVGVNGVPATCIERTLLDLCGLLPRRRAAIALDNSLSRGLTTIGELDYCLYRTARRGRNGCAVLRDLVKKRFQLDVFPTTPLETVVFEMFAESTLPMPDMQVDIHDKRGGLVARPDFVYLERKLVIEAHSRLWHEGKEARDSDVVRDEDLRREGFDVLYVTWADATRYRDRTMALIERRYHGLEDDSRAPWRAELLLS